MCVPKHPCIFPGKFLTVLLAGSVTGNIAMTFYSISLNIQVCLPDSLRSYVRLSSSPQVFIPSLIVVPRYVFSFLATGMYVNARSPRPY